MRPRRQTIDPGGLGDLVPAAHAVRTGEAGASGTAARSAFRRPGRIQKASRRLCGLLLALAELEAGAGTLLAVLLALLAAGITSDHAAGLERLAEFDVELHECAGDAELDSVGLAVDAATLDSGQDVEGLVDVGDAEGLLRGGALRRSDEVFLELLAVDGELARAGAEEDTSDCALAPAGSVILNEICHKLCPFPVRR